jgi:hypothetical protein
MRVFEVPDDTFTLTAIGDRPKREKLFSATWLVERHLPFFRANMCGVVDGLARLFCGIRILIKDQPGRIDWAFKTKEMAERHFLVCLLLVAGKPSFFRKLFFRAMKCSNFENDRRHVAVEVRSPTVDGLLFYVVMHPKCGLMRSMKEMHNLTGLWAICIPSTSADSECQFIDAWSWKDHTHMMADFKLLQDDFGLLRATAWHTEEDLASGDGKEARKRMRLQSRKQNRKSRRRYRADPPVVRQVDTMYHPVGDEFAALSAMNCGNLSDGDCEGFDTFERCL